MAHETPRYRLTFARQVAEGRGSAVVAYTGTPDQVRSVLNSCRRDLRHAQDEGDRASYHMFFADRGLRAEIRETALGWRRPSLLAAFAREGDDECFERLTQSFRTTEPWWLFECGPRGAE